MTITMMKEVEFDLLDALRNMPDNQLLEIIRTAASNFEKNGSIQKARDIINDPALDD